MKGKYLLVLMLTHAAIAIFLSYRLNVWADEASSLFSTEGSFLDFFRNAIVNEKQAPLYFVLLGIWRKVYDSIFFARILSLMFSLFAIKVFSNLTEKLVFDRLKANLLVTLFAIHPFLVWASTEIRMYSLTVLLSVWLIYVFVVLLEEKARSWACFVLLSALAIYVNYYLGFTLLAIFLAVLVFKKNVKKFTIGLLTVAVLISPLFLIVVEQFFVNTSGFREEKSLVEGIKTLWNHLLTFTLPIGLFPITESDTIAVLRNWLMRIFVIILLIFSWHKGVFFSETALLFTILSTVIGFCLLLAYFFLGIDYFQVRHASVLFVPLFFLFWFLLFEALPKKILIFFAAVCFLAYGYSFYVEYKPMAKRGDWARVARFIEENEHPSQPIVVFRCYDALALRYHYKGLNIILPDEKFFDWGLEGERNSENAFRNQIKFVISKVPKDAVEVWLVTEQICQEQTPACRDLENFVVSNYTILLQKDFYLERVRLLRRKDER
ncbi:MAG: hypothetical protein N2Z23_06550 [Pyrinomonadaceae bacterium]|nr:hypothetical protein [Pyrinomonadaceae bacterium]MCX7640082.1 hypothetical protein [Pyrinomonadaceae bacterium]